jgi:protein-S-isoprenylcysteine O-methyltransferase Ste14
MKTSYLVFVGLFFFGLMIRAVYEQLKKNGRIDPKNKVTFTIVFLAMNLLWASWFNMCPLDPIQLSMPRGVTWIAFCIFIAGLLLAIGAVVQLRGVENIGHLVTTGFFFKIRHPMYLGFILWILGWALYHGAVVSLLVGLVAVGNIFYWKRQEEWQLESIYGDIYVQYKNRTWF